MMTDDKDNQDILNGVTVRVAKKEQAENNFTLNDHHIHLHHLHHNSHLNNHHHHQQQQHLHQQQTNQQQQNSHHLLQPQQQTQQSQQNHQQQQQSLESVNDVCRDFLRNVCRRGSSCRYRHPDPNEAEELGKKIELIFCHDYQNRECRRQNCRFLHCTKQEEEMYRSSGKLPQHVLERINQTRSTLENSGKQIVGVNNSLQMTNIDSIPICKDFLKGECRRAARCRFRHISQADYELELRTENSLNNIHYNNQRNLNSNISCINNGNYNSERCFDSFAPPEPKRRAYEPGSSAFGTAYTFANERALPISSLNNTVTLTPEFNTTVTTSLCTPTTVTTLSHQSLLTSARYMEEENNALRRRCDELKKQVADLIATNEFLLEQNAQLRIGKTVPSSVNQPISQAITQAISQPINQSSLINPQVPSVSAAPVQQQQPGPLVQPLAPPISTDILVNQPVPIISISGNGLSPMSTCVTSSTQLIQYPIPTAAIQSLRPQTIPHSLSH